MPKFAVGQAVWVVYNYGRDFGLSNKAAEIVEIKQEDRANLYRVRYVLSGEEGTQFWEEYKILPREETKTKPVATRMRVNWSGRGFSSGDYEVLSYSRERGIVYLNISTDPTKPMPKAVRLIDCQ